MSSRFVFEILLDDYYSTCTYLQLPYFNLFLKNFFLKFLSMLPLIFRKRIWPFSQWSRKQGKESHQHNPVHTQTRHPQGAQKRRHVQIICVQCVTREERKEQITIHSGRRPHQWPWCSRHPSSKHVCCQITLYQCHLCQGSKIHDNWHIGLLPYNTSEMPSVYPHQHQQHTRGDHNRIQNQRKCRQQGNGVHPSQPRDVWTLATRTVSQESMSYWNIGSTKEDTTKAK